jgi:uncharacterized protein YbaP (TraB family)
MLKQYALCLSLGLSLNAAWGQPAPATEDSAVQNILVVGQRPGPALWKVTKDEHILWIFGTYSPLPKNMTWRSQQVENALAQSQELLEPPGSAFQVGWANSFNMLTAAPFLIGIKKNADGAHLQDVVPADVYARWTVLKTKYIGDDKSIEEERPIFAADTLFEKAIRASDMDKGYIIQDRVRELAKNWKIKRTSTTVMLPMENARAAVRDFKKAHLDDVECFTKTVNRLETDLDAMKVRANAWSMGNIDAIRKLSFPDQKQSCNAALVDSKWMGNLKDAGNLQQRIKASWLTAAEKSLANNKATFAMLPMSDLLNADGLLATLRARGYQINEPD